MLKVHLYVGPFTSVGTLLSWAPYLPGALSLQDGRFTIGPFTIIWSPLTPVSPLPRWGDSAVVCAGSDCYYYYYYYDYHHHYYY